MSVFLSPVGNGDHWLGSNALPANGGFINTYLAGTTTPAATYTTSAGNVANTNPIVLSPAGIPPFEIWLTGGVSYKFIITDILGVQIGPTYDNIYGIGDLTAPNVNNAANVSYTPVGSGATITNVAAKLGEFRSVKDFGAKGDGVTDDTAAINLALASTATEVFFPSGTYIISGTLLPSPHQILQGDSDSAGSPSSIQCSSGMNVAAIKFTNVGKLSRLSIVANATGATPNNWLVWITGCNNVVLDACLLSGGYDLVHIDGSSPAFYLSFFDCIFYACFRAQFYVNCSAAAGVDMIMSRCRFLTGGGTYCCYLNGLGSLVWSDVEFTGAPSNNGTLYMDQPAALFGGAQFTNCVFEPTLTTVGPAVHIVGTASTAVWQPVKFVNCVFGGGTGGQIALEVSYANKMSLTNCLLSSTGGSGAFFCDTGCFVLDATFTQCDWEGVAGTTPVQCFGAASVISASFTDNQWTGMAPMIDYSNSNNVRYLNVIGGNPGTNATPVKLNTDLSVPGVRSYQTPTNGGWVTYVPVATSGTGILTTVSASGWYLRINKVVHFIAVVTITTNGTGATSINVTLPSTASTGPPVLCYGRESASTGKMLQGLAVSGTGTVAVQNYDNTYPGGSGTVLNIFGTYLLP
jgi:hypothetical protein